LSFLHVDVFAPMPFSGNSLAVFPDGRGLTVGQMAEGTRELRHFDSVFLVSGDEPNSVRARVFDLLEELDFAGHPILGAACVLHPLHGGGGASTGTTTAASRMSRPAAAPGASRRCCVSDTGLRMDRLAT